MTTRYTTDFDLCHHSRDMYCGHGGQDPAIFRQWEEGLEPEQIVTLLRLKPATIANRIRAWRDGRRINCLSQLGYNRMRTIGALKCSPDRYRAARATINRNQRSIECLVDRNCHRNDWIDNLTSTAILYEFVVITTASRGDTLASIVQRSRVHYRRLHPNFSSQAQLR